MNLSELRKYKLPDSPGVYLFKKGRQILYIGKAASLRDRVRSYFSRDLAGARSPAIVGMVEEANALSWEETGSVLEALILEANLIKRHEPPFNVEQKDNKSWNYLVITKESASRRTLAGGFPRILLVRGRELFQEWNKADIRHQFGPFPHGKQLKEALEMVRRIFPFRDKCTPCDALRKRSTKDRPLDYQGPSLVECKPCFNRQLGLCPGVCSGEVSKEEYAEIIRNIKDLFSGKFKGLKQRLAREMKNAAKAESYEEAEKLRRQISALEHIHDVSLIKEERISSGGPSNMLRTGGARIEAYDVAHTSGTETVAVMTVVQNGEAVKAAYRKFKIRDATNNDVAALKEVISRRLNHSEWPLPRVFVVDGGKAQLRAAERVLEEAGLMIPVVGVVKNEFHKPKGLIGDARAIQAYEKDILLANNEAHRFGIAYHRDRRQKAMI